MSEMGKKVVICPTCEKLVVWHDENEYRPFCSGRCKLIDFGDWAAENTVFLAKWFFLKLMKIRKNYNNGRSIGINAEQYSK